MILPFSSDKSICHFLTETYTVFINIFLKE